MKFKTSSIIDRLGSRIRDSRYLRLLKEREQLDAQMARCHERHGVMQRIAGRYEHVSGVTRGERKEIAAHLTFGERIRLWAELVEDRFLSYSINITACMIGAITISRTFFDTDVITPSMINKETIVGMVAIIGITALAKATEHTANMSDLFLTYLYEGGHDEIMLRVAQERTDVTKAIRNASN